MAQGGTVVSIVSGVFQDEPIAMITYWLFPLGWRRIILQPIEVVNRDAESGLSNNAHFCFLPVRWIDLQRQGHCATQFTQITNQSS